MERNQCLPSSPLVPTPGCGHSCNTAFASPCAWVLDAHLKHCIRKFLPHIFNGGFKFEISNYDGISTPLVVNASDIRFAIWHGDLSSTILLPGETFPFKSPHSIVVSSLSRWRGTGLLQRKWKRLHHCVTGMFNALECVEFEASFVWTPKVLNGRIQNIRTLFIRQTNPIPVSDCAICLAHSVHLCISSRLIYVQYSDRSD